MEERSKKYLVKKKTLYMRIQNIPWTLHVYLTPKILKCFWSNLNCRSQHCYWICQHGMGWGVLEPALQLQESSFFLMSETQDTFYRTTLQVLRNLEEYLGRGISLRSFIDLTENILLLVVYIWIPEYRYPYFCTIAYGYNILWSSSS